MKKISLLIPLLLCGCSDMLFGSPEQSCIVPSIKETVLNLHKENLIEEGKSNLWFGNRIEQNVMNSAWSLSNIVLESHDKETGMITCGGTVYQHYEEDVGEWRVTYAIQPVLESHDNLITLYYD